MNSTTQGCSRDERERDRQTDRQRERETDRQTDRQTYTHTHTHTHTHIHYLAIKVPASPDNTSSLVHHARAQNADARSNCKRPPPWCQCAHAAKHQNRRAHCQANVANPSPDHGLLATNHVELLHRLFLALHGEEREKERTVVWNGVRRVKWQLRTVFQNFKTCEKKALESDMNRQLLKLSIFIATTCSTSHESSFAFISSSPYHTKKKFISTPLLCTSVCYWSGMA